jgi:hypothetical protein
MTPPSRWTGVLPALILAAGLPMGAAVARANVHIDLDHRGAANVSISDSAHVGPGQTHEGDIVSILGDVNVEGQVSGSVVVILGRLRVAGTVDGDVVSILTRARLEEGAVIEGEMVNIGGPLSRAPGVRVEGEMVNINVGQFIPLIRDEGLSALARLWLILKLTSLALLFLVVVLLAALVPRRLGVIAAAFPRRWGLALAIGLVAYAAFAVGFVILVMTILGIPLALALWVCMLGTKWIGLASIFLLIGQTAGRNLFGRELSHLAAILGGFAVYAILTLVPFFGLAFGLVLNVLSVGIALVSRYGSEEPWRLGEPGSGGAPPQSIHGAPPAPTPPPVYGS